jgi:malonyl-CoA/methylmalonyl-CoA synthetase
MTSINDWTGYEELRMAVEDPYRWIESVAQSAGHSTCLEDDLGRRMSYGEVHQSVGRYGAVLLDLGVHVGDRVALQVEKSLEAVLVYLACLRVGAAVVPLNTAYTPAELRHFISDSQPQVLIVDPAKTEVALEIAAANGCPTVETLGSRGDGSIANRAAMQSVGAPVISIAADTLAALLYTSGTTGRSKGAMITRGNLVANAQSLASGWRMTRADLLVHVLPLFHVHGLFLSLNAMFAVGAAVRIHRRFDPKETIESLSSASVFMGVPTHYMRLLACPELTPAAVSGVRLFISGSAPLLSDTHREFETKTGKLILERYGMTETLVNTSNPYHGVRKPGSVGLPLPDVELRITDQRTDNDGPNVGMIEIRGPNVCAGYWRAPEQTAADRTIDGFFRTGDLGFIDSDGYLHISGRAKDLVITGGYNVYPKEIELDLDSLDPISESAVFGVPHRDFGEAVTAAVTLKPSAALHEATVIELLRNRLASYKVPKRVIVVDELPKNTMGKIQKNKLRECFAHLYLDTFAKPIGNR